MKYIFSFLATMLIGISSVAQQGIVGQYLRLSPSSLPAVCRNGDIRFDSSSTQLEFCSSNVWSAFSSVPGGGTGTTGFQQYSLVVGGATSLTSLGTGTSSQFLQSQGSGANPIWYSLFPVSVANGGTGATTIAGLRTSIGAAASGANSDITSITGLSTPLAVSQGGIGAATETAHSVLVGQGTSAVTNTGVGTSGQVLTSNGTGNDPTWVSVAGSGTVTSVAAGAGLTTGSASPITSSGSLSLIAPVSVVNGGTGQTNAYNSFGVHYSPSGGLSTTSISQGTSGQVLMSNGAAAPSMQTIPGNTTIVKALTTQKFLLTNYYTFTVTASTWAAGDTYTNNTQTFTAIYASTVSSTNFVASATGAPAASGTLTRATGSGSSTIAFSAQVHTGTYFPPTNPAPIYIRVRGSGGGGGGGGSGITGGLGGTGVNGTATTFGSSFLTANGGTGGNNVSVGGPGTGGSASISTASGFGVTGGAGGGGFAASINTAIGPSGPGGGNPLGGAGGSLTASASSFAAAANTGGGGGGASMTELSTQNTGNGGGAGGYFDAIVTSPTSVAYFVGPGGAGGTLGTTGAAGGAGGSGILIVDEYYQ